MEQAQIEQLGSKMRDAYEDIASEPAVPSSKRASRRLRKSPIFGHAGQHARSSSGSLVMQHPIASLLTAAAIGYVLARL